MAKEIRLKPPLSEEDVRQLHVGDKVYIDGIIYTWRDRAQERAFQRIERGEKPLPIDLEGGVHWHCGPVTKMVDDKWVVTSAGPTGSGKLAVFDVKAIREYGLRLLVGKGSMGKEARDAMKECGAAFLSSVGGAAAYYAHMIERVKEVHWLEAGQPEAIWVLEVKAFGPLLVSVDSHGNDWYAQIDETAKENQLKIYERLGLGKPGHGQRMFLVPRP